MLVDVLKHRGEKMREKRRDKNVDTVKGLLIILVVTAHFQRDIIHDMIFLFHMPLFFILSGIFLQKEKLISKGYLKNKAVSLLIPYCIYLLFDLFFIQRDYSIGSIVRAVWGGRSISGAYWYITCFLFTLFVLGFLLNHFSEKTVNV